MSEKQITMCGRVLLVVIGAALVAAINQPATAQREKPPQDAMSRRDAMAAQCLAAILSATRGLPEYSYAPDARAARCREAVKHADDLISELDRKARDPGNGQASYKPFVPAAPEPIEARPTLAGAESSCEAL